MNRLKRLLIWSWMAVLGIGYRVMIIDLGRIISRYGRETGYSNCLLFAIDKQRLAGGYLLVSKSERGWWHHVRWTPDLSEYIEYTPDKGSAPRCAWVARRLHVPPIAFRGVIGPWMPLMPALEMVYL